MVWQIQVEHFLFKDVRYPAMCLIAAGFRRRDFWFVSRFCHAGPIFWCFLLSTGLKLRETSTPG